MKVMKVVVLWTLFLVVSLIGDSKARVSDEAEHIQATLSQAANQDWDYFDIRDGVHTFWWLFETTHSDRVNNRPLILWIQGGPGLSGTGYGNFQLIGPLDRDMNTRSTSWVTEASVLFVDNPAGTGFSYVDNDDAYAKDIDTISSDLLVFMIQFLERHPLFKSQPLYIMGQSYGGKMTAAFAKTIYQANEAGSIECNLRGFAMGNSWISPADSTMAIGPQLLDMSLIDSKEYDIIQGKAEAFVTAMDAGEWETSTSLVQDVYDAVTKYTQIDFYNILLFEDSQDLQERRRRSNTQQSGNLVHLGLVNPLLKPFMNEHIREYLGIIPDHVKWLANVDKVSMNQWEDLTKPVYDRVAWMLENTDVQAVVYQGQLDIICNARGAMNWVERLDWSGLEEYRQAPKQHLLNPDTNAHEMFLKAHENLKFFWVMGAGHGVPEDQPGAALRMLRQILAADTAGDPQQQINT